jgi:hypothetical protein
LHASALCLVSAGPVAPYSSAASAVLHNHPREIGQSQKSAGFTGKSRDKSKFQIKNIDFLLPFMNDVCSYH